MLHRMTYFTQILGFVFKIFYTIVVFSEMFSVGRDQELRNEDGYLNPLKIKFYPVWVKIIRISFFSFSLLVIFISFLRLRVTQKALQ